MTICQLKQKRNHLMDIACDFIYLIVNCKYSELNKVREEELLKLKKRIKKLDALIAEKSR